MRSLEHFQGGSEGYEGYGSRPRVVISGPSSLMSATHRDHFDTTFRGWCSTLSARVRLVLSRLVMIFVLPLDFHGRILVVRSMYLPAALHGVESSLLGL